MNLKDHSAFFQREESLKEAIRKPTTDLLLSYYKTDWETEGRLYSTILKKTGYHIRRKKRLPTAFALKAAWKERLHNQKAKALVLPSVLLGI